ncbi:MAG: hypothetical protein IT515_06580 [Burkholderiales bacterium]|nr:hypothetical protein [Burkholderiales bacterium]
MDRRTVLTKTAKGLMEVTGKTSLLSREHRSVLSQVDGKATVGDIHQKLDKFSETKLLETLGRLSKDGFVREFISAPTSISPPSQVPIVQEGPDLDFTDIASQPPNRSQDAAREQAEADDVARQVAVARAKSETDARAKADADSRARVEAEKRAKAEAETRAKREVEERATRESAAKEKAKREAQETEEKAKRAAEDKARREAEELARRAADDRAKREAEEKAVREAEERAERKRREEEERARREREDEERIRRELESRIRAAEEAAQREAEARRKREAEERTRREAEERARREAEERARREAEERARREAEERAQREAEEQARREAAERAERVGREAAERAEREAEEKARREADEQARAEAARRARDEEKARAKTEAESAARARREERTREKAEADERAQERAKEDQKSRAEVAARLEAIKTGRQGRLGKILATAVVIALVAAVIVAQFLPLDTAFYERLASQKLGVPVRIGSGVLSALPTPTMKFTDVVVGKDGAVRIATVEAAPEIGSLFGETRLLKSLELKGVSARPDALAGVLWGRMAGKDLAFDTVHAANVKLALPGVALPELEVTATLGPGGALEKLMASTAGKHLVAQIQPQPGKASVDIAARDLQGTLGLQLSIEDFTARAVAVPGELVLSQFDGKILDGFLKGQGRLRWGAGWTFEGDVEIKQVDMARVAPSVFSSGRLEGQGKVLAQAATAEKLLSDPRVDGTFVIQRGQLSTLDLARMIQTGGASAGSTSFNEVTGQVSSGSQRVQLRNLRMLAGPLSASGNIELESDSISGRISAEMNTPAGVRRGNLSLTGSISKLQAGR